MIYIANSKNKKKTHEIMGAVGSGYLFFHDTNKKFTRKLHFPVVLSINFITLESLFRKELAILLFLSLISVKQQSTISENSKFIGSIYRILKSQKTISLAKVFHRQSN